MNRSVPADARAALERESSPDALIAFLLIEHPRLPGGLLRLVCDVLDYSWGGHVWTGVPFRYSVVSDRESGAAEARVSVPNVDREIGEALRAINDRARLSMTILSAADFDLTVNPRAEIETAAVVYSYANYELTDARGDVAEVSGRVTLRDYSREPWPAVRAIPSVAPGLHA